MADSTEIAPQFLPHHVEQQQQSSVRVGIPIQAAKNESDVERDEDPPRPSVTIHRSGSIDILSSTGLNIEVSSSKDGETRNITTAAAARDAPEKGTVSDSDSADEENNNEEDVLSHMDIPSPAPAWKATTRGHVM